MRDTLYMSHVQTYRGMLLHLNLPPNSVYLSESTHQSYLAKTVCACSNSLRIVCLLSSPRTVTIAS